MVSVQAPEDVEQAQLSDGAYKIAISDEVLHVRALDREIEPETLATADPVRASV